jgi:hypothetical protein
MIHQDPSGLIKHLLSRYPRRRDQLMKAIHQMISPLREITDANDDTSSETDSRDASVFGGGGSVPAQGASVTLGGAYTGSTIAVSVGGPATVWIHMWMPLAQIPAGVWKIGGPATVNIFLGCNVAPGCSVPAGQLATINAVGEGGLFPVWVSYNP